MILIVYLATVFMACISDPESDGKALGAEFCSAYRELDSDSKEARSLEVQFLDKSNEESQKYMRNPELHTRFMKGYGAVVTECIKNREKKTP